MTATFYTMKYFRGIVSVKDKRISLTTDVITGIKSIKYLSWENLFLNKILLKRKDEYKYLIKFRILDGILSVFWVCFNNILLLLTLLSFINN